MSPKCSPFPPAYVWTDPDDFKEVPMQWDDPTRLAMSQFFVQYDDTLRHQMRQMRQPWLMFVLIRQRSVYVSAHTVSTGADGALLKSAEILPPISGERSVSSATAVLLRPGLEAAPLYGISRDTEGNIRCHGQNTGYMLDDHLFSGERLLKPYEVEMLQMVGERTRRAAEDAGVLDALARMLSREEWNSDLFNKAAELVRASGRPVTELTGATA